MIIEEIYKQFMREHDTNTNEGEEALSMAEHNDSQFDAIAAGPDSSHRAGFFAGFRAAVQLMQEVAR